MMLLLPPIVLVLCIVGANYLEGMREHIFGDLQASVCRESAPDPRLGTVSVPKLLRGASKPPSPPPPERAPFAEPTVSKTDSRREESLALHYEPVLKIATADRFWPVPVPVVLELLGEGRHTHFIDSDGKVGDAEISNLQATGDLAERLDYPSKLEHVQDEFCSVGHALGISPVALARWSSHPNQLRPGLSAQFYFFDRTFADGSKDLQYWFFYPYNYLPVLTKDSFPSDPVEATSYAADFHEGDFEHVTVQLRPDPDAKPSPDGEIPLIPTGVEMARHKSEQKTLRWNRPSELKRIGTHPVVFAGFGGHASYNDCGRQVRRVTFFPIRLLDWSLCAKARTFTLGFRTPLVDLRQVGWPCWPGHFGEVPKLRIPNFRESGPKSPFYQAGNQPRCGSRLALHARPFARSTPASADTRPIRFAPG